MTNNKSSHIHLEYGSAVHCYACDGQSVAVKTVQLHRFDGFSTIPYPFAYHETKHINTLACCSALATGQPLIQIHKNVF